MYLSDDGATLAFAKAGCAPADLRARFFLNVVPRDENDLSSSRRSSGYESHRFSFHHQGGRIDDKCWAVTSLPEYPIDRIHAGQYISGEGTVWQIEANLAALKEIREIEAGLEDMRLIESGLFEVYSGGGRLIYRKEPCIETDVMAKFFLHLTPVEHADLPAHRWQHTFDNLDFHFEQRGVFLGRKCLAAIPLPDYAIARIRTGQFAPGEGQLWRAEFAPGR